MTALETSVRHDLKPTILILSAAESLPIVYALIEALDSPDIIMIPWTTDVFRPSKGALESLPPAIQGADFVVAVVDGKDVVESRGVTRSAPRDNVVFELGMAINQLGISRAFWLYDREHEPKLPSDLAGITALTYNGGALSKNAISPLAPTASKIKRVVDELGMRPERLVRGTEVYLCGPHKHQDNAPVAALLRQRGLEVHLPSRLVPPNPTAAQVRSHCSEAILRSDVMAVNITAYGLDSAFEMGFAEAKEIPVIGYSDNFAVLERPREVNKYPYKLNEMHGWDEHDIFKRLKDVAASCRGKTVHLCCPFKNKAAIDEIKTSTALKDAGCQVIIPVDELKPGDREPRDYPGRTREKAIRLLQNADIVLTVLPRYGMDTAWKLGYAAALGKPIIGWLADHDEATEISEAYILDHWMHGWREKTLITSGFLALADHISGLTPRQRP